MSNAIRKDNPLSAGRCLHGVPMSEDCEWCEEPRTGHLSPDYLKGFEDGQKTLRRGETTESFEAFLRCHGDPSKLSDPMREILRIFYEAGGGADAARYRWLREHAYIELHCDSPRVDGWHPSMLDRKVDAAIDRAKEPSASSRIAGQEKKESPHG